MLKLLVLKKSLYWLREHNLCANKCNCKVFIRNQINKLHFLSLKEYYIARFFYTKGY